MPKTSVIQTIKAFIWRSLAAPIFPDPIKTRHAAILNRVLIAMTVMWLASVLLLAIAQAGNVSNLIISMAFILLLQILRIGLLKGIVRPTASILPFLTFGVLFLQLYNLGTIFTNHLIGLLINILLATLLLGPWGGAFFTVISVAAIWWISQAEMSHALPPATRLSVTNQWINFTGYAIFLYGLVATTRQALFKTLDQALKEIEHRQKAEDEIRQLNASLDQRVAERTQALEEEVEKHKQTETRLRLLSQAVEQSPVSVIITDPDGLIEYVNAKFCQATGYSAAEVLGQNPRILKSGEKSPEEYRAMWETIKSGNEWRGEFHNRRKDGALFWESASLSPVMDANNVITHFLAIKEDITQRKMMELALKSNNESLQALHECTLDFLQKRDFNELLQSLVNHATHLMDAPYAVILMIEGEKLVAQAQSRAQPFMVKEQLTRNDIMPIWNVIDTHKPLVVAEFSQIDTLNEDLDHQMHAVASFPILSGERCLGVLSLGRDRPGDVFTPEQVQIGLLFAQVAALAMENVQLSSEMYEQSIRDPLTGLYNRRYLFEVLPREEARATRLGQPISFALIDIDCFKSVNDYYGHGAGDMALCSLANLLRSKVRSGDILCRYGGDEHIVVMYNTPAAIAIERANEWRRAAEMLPLAYEGKGIKITISIGVATFPSHGSSIDEVIGRADQALYHSKNNGRNRATLFGG